MKSDYYLKLFERENRRSREGAWIEISDVDAYRLQAKVAPARERGLKYGQRYHAFTKSFVAPARERGLKSLGR